MDISFQNSGNVLVPVTLKGDVVFYVEAENFVIDVITFSDYLN